MQTLNEGQYPSLEHILFGNPDLFDTPSIEEPETEKLQYQVGSDSLLPTSAYVCSIACWWSLNELYASDWFNRKILHFNWRRIFCKVF